MASGGGARRWVAHPAVLGALAVGAFVAVLLPAYLLAWFAPGVPHGQTCDLVHQPWCRPGRGLPQWWATAVLVASCLGSGAVALVATLAARRRLLERAVWAAAVLAALALALTLAAEGPLGAVVPSGWLI